MVSTLEEIRYRALSIGKYTLQEFLGLSTAVKNSFGDDLLVRELEAAIPVCLPELKEKDFKYNISRILTLIPVFNHLKLVTSATSDVLYSICDFLQQETVGETISSVIRTHVAGYTPDMLTCTDVDLYIINTT